MFNGVFELVDETPRYHAGRKKMEVCCAWFGVNPPTRYPYLDISTAEIELIGDYTGKVVDDIGTSEKSSLMCDKDTDS